MVRMPLSLNLRVWVQLKYPSRGCMEFNGTWNFVNFGMWNSVNFKVWKRLNSFVNPVTVQKMKKFTYSNNSAPNNNVNNVVVLVIA